MKPQATAFGGGRWWLLGTVRRGHGPHAAFLQTMVAQVLVVAVNVATGVITARLLGPEGRGAFAAITLWPQFLAAVGLAGLPYSLVYHLRNNPQARPEILGTALALTVAVGCVAATLGALAVPMAMAHGYSAAVIAFAQAGTGLTLVSIVSMLLKRSLGAVELQGMANWFGLADPLVYLGLLLAAATLSPVFTAEIAAACLFAGSAVTLVAVLPRLPAGCRPSFRGVSGWAGRVGGYAVRAAPAGLTESLAGYLDRFVLVALISPAELGLYAVAYALSRLMGVVQSAVASVGMPAMAGRSPADTKALHDRLFRFVLFAVAVIVAGGFALGGTAISFVYGAQFAMAATLFHILVVEAALTCLGQVVAQLYYCLGRPGHVSTAQALAFLVSGAAMLLLVPGLGALGAAAGLAAGAALRLAFLLAGLPLMLQVPLPRPVPTRGEFALLVLALRRA